MIRQNCWERELKKSNDGLEELSINVAKCQGWAGPQVFDLISVIGIDHTFVAPLQQHLVCVTATNPTEQEVAAPIKQPCQNVADWHTSMLNRTWNEKSIWSAFKH